MTTLPDDDELRKYPRTRHIAGSRLQAGDEDLTQIPFAELAGRPLVVEEKMDGANAGVSFNAAGELRLQSRGHYLVGGERERHFDLFKRWAATHVAALRGVLGARHVLYGEWLYAKHTVFYNDLPHYFLEFDVLDRERGEFLDTPRRRALLRPLGAAIVPVLVLHTGPLRTQAALRALLGPSCFIRHGHLAELRGELERRGLDAERGLRETDGSPLMEGLYVKLEEGGVVRGRYKHVRDTFLGAVAQAEGHWLDRPIVPNRLRAGVELFGADPP